MNNRLLWYRIIDEELASALFVGLTLESIKRCLRVRTHSQQAVLVLLSVVESVLQGHSVFLADFLQSSSLALLHLAGLFFRSSSHIAHLLLVGCLLLEQGLAEIEDKYACTNTFNICSKVRDMIDDTH